jgi:hypothetical protein
MTLDLFGEEIEEGSACHVSVYADEIQHVRNIVTGEEWIYAGAIYEDVNQPILDDLVDRRYCISKFPDWEKHKDKNNSQVHWTALRGDHNKKFVIQRWLEYVLEDCLPTNRKFYYSVFGINVTNLNLTEFGDEQQFNNVYNRFFRAMLKYSLKKFFGRGVIVDHIYHEQGQQEKHEYFEWHTIFTLDLDEHLNFATDRVEFLPKDHKQDSRSNIIQLCDVLLGIFKDVHLGYEERSYSPLRKEILDSRFVRELLIKRIIKAPGNINSSFGYAKRFQVSLFPKTRSDPGSLLRSQDNYYDISKIQLGIEHNPNQQSLF